VLDIGDQRELADDQRRPACVQQVAVKSALVVLEDPEPGHLSGEAHGLLVAVTARDAEQDAETGADHADDLAAYRDPGRRDLLNDGPHALVAHAGCVATATGPEREGELVVAVRLGGLALLFETAAERVVRVVVSGREFEDFPEL
jgi:hypothetical protein